MRELDDDERVSKLCEAVCQLDVLFTLYWLHQLTDKSKVNDCGE